MIKAHLKRARGSVTFSLSFVFTNDEICRRIVFNPEFLQAAEAVLARRIIRGAKP